MTRAGDTVVLIGASAGGMDALSRLLPDLPAAFSAPVLIVQHLHPSQDAFLVEHFGRLCALKVKEVEDKQAVFPGVVYLGPANYHLLVEEDRTFSLSTDEKVNHSRPSIDVLFESAADVYGPGAIAVILTGASQDGAAGLAAIRAGGGIAVVQDPETADFPFMPRAALEAAGADYIAPIEEIGPLIAQLVNKHAAAGSAR